MPRPWYAKAGGDRLGGMAAANDGSPEKRRIFGETILRRKTKRCYNKTAIIECLPEQQVSIFNEPVKG